MLSLERLRPNYLNILGRETAQGTHPKVMP